MSDTLRKRGLDPQALLDSIDAGHPKRLCSEETDRFLHLLQLQKTLSEDDDDECGPSEELVNRVMKSLEEEIEATSSTCHHTFNSGDNLAADNASRGDQGRTQASDLGDDLSYPWDASHGDPGIPPNPILDLKDEICQSPQRTLDGLSDWMDVKSLAENWHLEDDFESYRQFALYEDAWHASQLQDCRNFVSQGMLFDGDFSAECVGILIPTAQRQADVGSQLSQHAAPETARTKPPSCSHRLWQKAVSAGGAPNTFTCRHASPVRTMKPLFPGR